MSRKPTGRPNGLTRAAERRVAENRARLLAAGHAIHARTGRPPSLSGLVAESGLTRSVANKTRRGLAAAGDWPWEVAPVGPQARRDESGLTRRQAEWLEAFRLRPSLVMADVAREFGVHPSVAWEQYRRLRGKGFDLPPLAHRRRPRANPPGGIVAADRAEHARRLEIVREVRAEFWGSGRPWTHEQYHARLDERLGDTAGVTASRRRPA